MYKICSLSLLVLFLISGCGKTSQKRVKVKEQPLKYAKNFSITTENGYKVLHIKNPWQQGTYLAELVLDNKNETVPEKLLKKYTVLKTPVERIATFSHTNIGFLSLLNETKRLNAVGTPETIYNKDVYSAYKEGKVANIGSDLQLDLERLINTAPQLIMKSGYPQSAQNDEHLKSIGIPLVYNIEWMETNMLARAEWVKVLGVLTNQEVKADSVFNEIESRYKQLIKSTDKMKKSPRVMMGNDFKGVWYVPGGKSYKAELLKQINVNYFLANDTTSGSKAFSYEVVLDEMMKSDIWLYSGSVIAKGELKTDERYAMFKPVKENHVYGPFKRINVRNANDYWESGMGRPDLVLADLIAIFYPDLHPNYELYYYKKLN
ncbi:hypothetical protein EMN47_17405 [Prolixibacteraceae bacterium JC049]|nr:hypothetical protein [Prolixibacteraceae bacterium JC049]